jgi:macrolide transport system ATP-binding/permease protein
LEHHVEKYARSGLTRAEAMRRAMIDLGGTEQTKEQCREAWGVMLIDTVMQDMRYAIRGFRRTPGFVLTVVVTIALGLGLNMMVFTIFNAYVLRPLSVRDPYSLYGFEWMSRNGYSHRDFSWEEFQDFERHNGAFSEVMGRDRLGLVRVEGHTVFGELVTRNYFRMLGINAAFGRTLLPHDVGAPGNSPVLVLSYSAWRDKFGNDPNIVGKRIIIRGYPLQVVGVARKGFSGLSEVPLDFWAPITMAPQLEEGPNLFGWEHPQRIRIIGRLHRGWDRRRAELRLQRGRSSGPRTGPIRKKRSERFSVQKQPRYPSTLCLSLLCRLSLWLLDSCS